VGKLGNAYFYRNEMQVRRISSTVSSFPRKEETQNANHLLGFGTAWVQHSWVLLRGCGGGITAWRGTNTTFSNKYGVYISDSFLTAANSSIAPAIVGKCFLGRPWNALYRSVYLNTYMDMSIEPVGYVKWSTNPATDNYGPNTTMAEYNSRGPGFNLTARLAGNITIEFTARAYRTPKDVFMTRDGSQPDISWIDTDAYTW
jgi:hypothetical protein